MTGSDSPDRPNAVEAAPGVAQAAETIHQEMSKAIVGQAVILRGHRSPEALAAIRDYWAPKSQRNSAHAPKSHAAHPHN